MCLRQLVCVLLLVIALPTLAGEIVLSCTDPTQNEDGTDLTDLAGVRIYESQVSGGPYNQVQDVANCAAIPVLNRAEGTYYFVATAYNIAGVESAYSNEASKTVTTVPLPPDNLVVQDNAMLAYTFDKIRGGLSVYPIGTVPPGTPCDSSVSVNGMYKVDAAAVVYPPNVSLDPFVVVAACGPG